MKYRINNDLYLSEAKVDFKAPGEFESGDYEELTEELLAALVGSGTIEAIAKPETAKTKTAPKESVA